MILASLYGFLSILYYNQWHRISSVVNSNYFSAHLVYCSFIFSMINIPIFIIFSLILLIIRQRIGLALILIVATIIYVIFGRMMGDSW
jgi:hypothetical protein